MNIYACRSSQNGAESPYSKELQPPVFPYEFKLMRSAARIS